MDSLKYIYLVMITGYIICLSVNSFEIEELSGKKCYRAKPVVAFLYIIPLIYFAWQRDLSIGDSGSYTVMFQRLPSDFFGLVSYLEINSKDPGFTIFCWLIKIVGGTPRFMFLTIAVIQGCSLFYVYRKYSSNYYLSILLFVISTDYVSWMQNGVRQFLAVSIIFAATSWLLEKRYFRMILVVLFASLFHQSALLMMPVIFIVNGKALNTKMLIVMLLILASITFLSAFTNILEGVLQETQYQTVVSDYTVGEFVEDDGTNPFRILVYSIPVIIGLVGKKIIDYKDNKVINLSMNMGMLTAGFYLVSAFTSGIFLGRIPIYFSLYNYILIPWELKYIFKPSEAKYITILMIVLYLIFSQIQFSLF